MMHMTLYWGKDVTLLFDSWKTNSWPSYGLALLACFLFSVFYQYLEDRRSKFKSSVGSTSSGTPSIDAPLLLKRGCPPLGARIASAAMFGFSSAIGYAMMLAIMSFNGGVFVAVVVGLAAGYFLFRSGDFDDDVVVVENNACACS